MVGSVIGSVIGAGGAIIGGALEKKGAQAAADASLEAAALTTEEARRQFDLVFDEAQRQFRISRSDTAPYRAAGEASVNLLRRLLLGERAGDYRPDQLSTTQGPSSAPTGTAQAVAQATAKTAPAVGQAPSQPFQIRLADIPGLRFEELSAEGAGAGTMLQGVSPGGGVLLAEGGPNDWRNATVTYDPATGKLSGVPTQWGLRDMTVSEPIRSQVNQRFTMPPFSQPAVQPAAQTGAQAGAGAGAGGTAGVEGPTGFDVLPGVAETGEVDFEKLSPGYQFRIREGQKGVERAQAARGSRLGGRALKELTRYNQDYAKDEYANWVNRIFNLAGYGPAGTGQSASSGQSLVSALNAANPTSTIGHANLQAARTAGTALQSGYGGINDAIQGGIENILTGIGTRQQQQNPAAALPTGNRFMRNVDQSFPF